ncbi:MAG: hypothetical protein CM1200mP30_02140 [Pseudomonadota bacterium]|nr:MAG: hypothetical protein CM1200mP30_02140 [Pseudomonadota bacterium]
MVFVLLHLSYCSSAGKLDSCNEATDDEEDMLDLAPGLEPQSRLACQCVPEGFPQDIIVEIPEWNRNLVSETH